jgi:hypothetical protein
MANPQLTAGIYARISYVRREDGTQPLRGGCGVSGGERRSEPVTALNGSASAGAVQLASMLREDSSSPSPVLR